MLDPTVMALDDPFSLVLDGILDKIGRDKDPFGAKYLHEWINANFGRLNLWAYTGENPIDLSRPPLPGDCPLLVIAGSDSPPFAPHGEGAHQLPMIYDFIGFIATNDQRVANRFRWLVMAAIGYPYLNPLDPISKATPLLSKYLMVGGQGPYPIESDGGLLFGWHFPVEFTFQGINLPFFRAL